MGTRSFVTEGFSSDALEPSAVPDLHPGMRLGRYELLAHLSSGGMAHVWIARQLGGHGFERLVAIKTIRPEHGDESFRHMFLDEARIAARIRHANVVEVFDLGSEGAIVFQAMTLVEGDSLSGLLRRAHERGSHMPFSIGVRILADALAGLHAAHELRGDDGRPMELVHRDVSPPNILVGLDGSVRLADFGIAKALGRLTAETDAGQMKGKYAYSSPEQLRRQPLDRRSDIFSAGIVLWEAFTGERLFVGVDMMDTISRALAGDVPDPRTIAAELPEPLARVVQRALAREPHERYASAAEMSDALEDAARRADMAATAKDVASFVAALCGDDVARRRKDIRDTSRPAANASTTEVLAPVLERDGGAARPEMTMAATTHTLGTEAIGSIATARVRRRPLWAAIMVVVSVGLMAGAAAVARVVERRAAPATMAAPPEASLLAPAVEPPNGEIAAASQPAPERSSTPSRRPGSAPRPRVLAPTTASSLKPRYANPYENK